MFRTYPVIPGITHITDEMGVSFTLIEGSKRAVLFDTGYGTENVRAFVSSVTDKQTEVLLSHGHHDHVLGARWFEKTFLCREDMDEFLQRTGLSQREQVAEQARGNNVALPEDFLNAYIQVPEPISFPDRTAGFDSLTEDLGGITIRVIRVPGHTPGSIVLYVPEKGLLLTGDNWNPCTWMWFPSSMNAVGWRENMLRLTNTLKQENGIRQVLCSHQPAIRDGKELDAYLDFMTEDRMREAPAVDMGTPIDTHQIKKGEWTLIFDRTKLIRT